MACTCKGHWNIQTKLWCHHIENLENVFESDSFSAEQRSTASGFIAILTKPNFLLGVTMALEICNRLEKVNAACQGISQSLTGATAAVELIVNDLRKLRTEDVFQQMFEKVNLELQANNLQQISLPRQRKPPARFTGNAQAFVASSAMEHYRAIFHSVGHHNNPTASQVPPGKHETLQ